MVTVMTHGNQAAPRPPLPRTVAAPCFRHPMLIGSFILTLLLVHTLVEDAQLLRAYHSSQWPTIQPHLPLSDLSQIPPNIYASSHASVLFCYIPYNAHTQFNAMLQTKNRSSDQRPSHEFSTPRQEQRLSSLEHKRALNILGNETASFKFVVVRDPIVRFLTAYRDSMLVTENNIRQDTWRRHLFNQCPSFLATRVVPSEGPLLSVDDFLSCLTANDSLRATFENWRSQTELCGLNHIKYDMYLHMESLKDDASLLLSVLGKKYDMSMIVDENLYTVGLSREDAHHLSSEQLSTIARIYREDLDVLKYKDPTES